MKRGTTPYIQILNFITLVFFYANEQIDGSIWKSIIGENQTPEQQTREILHNGDDQNASIQNEPSSAAN
ncbi:unnamed protein product [Adineta steineri]|uniref:Uncharacterized protein n=1 Tax=Adineta steineri TaxID=433720 RepID=A0A815EYJ7_9BILA|nr:unnamed protein product [Adineta steineri]CAF1318580.1 unnamed protein product [Adineta steineri]